ncbi:putative hydrolase or acyltransferase of alpha/beta superfamily [Caulobacter sp. AP07]|uniref:alpha/beta fold hydrolase n=1 Tax=Caulobacter sp. AP07 TaxID=1144304 RepID=UPI000271FCB6|nr:alpha/beta hydrolase [Caulobacter sp. AP07]EJL30382.1 putative hydrolase or acyltransferase of alpha/beta superfamily [Caulobacter sp. AP07]
MARSDLDTRVARDPDRRAVLGAALGSLVLAAGGTPALARTPVRNIVLVHGAWADGSCWTDVIVRLQAAGFNVTAVQNPLTSLADDVAATRRALALQDGPTVLVGHSWGGTVITQAGDDPKVTALVYVAARAPDAGEDFNALAARYPTMPARAGVLKADGFSRLSEEAFLKHFAGDVERSRARVLYAAQQPIADDLFTGKTTVAAWRTKPSFYAVSALDQTTSPELERFLAARMKARTIELASSHLSMISHAPAIADLISTAANATG